MDLIGDMHDTFAGSSRADPGLPHHQSSRAAAASRVRTRLQALKWGGGGGDDGVVPDVSALCVIAVVIVQWWAVFSQAEARKL